MKNIMVDGSEYIYGDDEVVYGIITSDGALFSGNEIVEEVLKSMAEVDNEK